MGKLSIAPRAGLLEDGALVKLAAKALGLVVEWAEELSAFRVVSGKWPRTTFAPMDSDADAFLLPCRLVDMPVDLILYRAHESFNQVELIPLYVRRNLVLAAAERALATEEERHAHGW